MNLLNKVNDNSEHNISEDDFINAYIGIKKSDDKNIELSDEDYDKIKSALGIAILEFEKVKANCNDIEVYNRMNTVISDFNQTLQKL